MIAVQASDEEPVDKKKSKIRHEESKELESVFS
jgi:hypothetical protein